MSPPEELLFTKEELEEINRELAQIGGDHRQWCKKQEEEERRRKNDDDGGAFFFPG